MTTNTTSLLAGLSADLVNLVTKVRKSVVRVEDGSRLTATGLIWSSDGYIVTSSHGLERDNDLKIETWDGNEFPVALIGRDNDTDIALLRANADTATHQWNPVEKSTREEAQIGALTMAVALPGRAGLQSTLGVISGIMESRSGESEEYLLQTDALLYPGFSGGGLFSVEGALLGMIDLLYGRGKGIALGIPILERSVAHLLNFGTSQRPYLGIRTQQAVLPSNLKSALTLDQDHGLLVIQVEPDTAAYRANLLLGDTLLRVNGQATPDVDALRAVLLQLQVGQTVDLQILRGGELRDLQTELGAAK